LVANLNARISDRFTLSGFYALGSARSNTDGAGGFPANQYDLSSEYGRAGFDIRHRLQLNGSYTPRWGVRMSPFITITSGRPFNLTTGRDLNGDGLFNDRPAFATDALRSTAVRTAFGVFDTTPAATQAIIPRNYGGGPGMVAVNMRLSKVFSFGEQPAKGGKAKDDPKQLTFSINARNLLNHPNLAAPNGNLSSLLFGRSTSLLGGQGMSGNRRIDLQMKFSF
jgi:hypothetical protein